MAEYKREMAKLVMDGESGEEGGKHIVEERAAG